MSDDGTPSLFDPRTVLAINERPLQLPGRDRLVRTVTIAGPDLAGDRRFFLSTKLLEECLSIARASPTGRCSLDRVGLRVDLYEDRRGHHYEVWTVIGVGPKPEPMPAAIGALIGRS